MYITRRERFASAHRLYNPKLDSKSNKQLFEKCHDLHGHNYQLFVTVTGNINPDSGFVIDLKDLKQIIHTHIINKLDHKLINDVDFMKDTIATTENLCLKIWNELEKPIQEIGAKLYKIKILETENNFVEYFG
tara:strand:- start:121 stop:519 length:399 start_codon:yes stop_codon:yes gene_type:complete